MRRLLVPSFCALLLAFTAPAHGQVFGQYAAATVVPVSDHLFGGYVQLSNGRLGLLAQLRLSFYPDVDFGFHGGLTRTDVGTQDVTTIQIGSDLKWLVAKGGSVDVALGGALGVETGDDVSLLTIGPSVVLSRRFDVGSGGVTPYGGVGVLFTRADLEGFDSTDMSVPFRFGAEFALSQEIRLVAEFQLRASDEVNDDASFATGVNLPF